MRTSWLTLRGEPRLKPFALGIASLKAPKEFGGLNIEGLCTTTNGSLLIGLRNPIPQERALIVPLQNPAEMLEGKPARFGDPILLDLGGRGVRGMAHTGGRFFIIAGSYDAKGHSHFYEWTGDPKDAPRKVPDTRFKGMNPEAFGLSERAAK